jgi:hypothetical protein
MAPLGNINRDECGQAVRIEVVGTEWLSSQFPVEEVATIRPRGCDIPVEVGDRKARLSVPASAVARDFSPIDATRIHTRCAAAEPVLHGTSMKSPLARQAASRDSASPVMGSAV